MSVPNEVKLLLCFDDSSKLALSIPLAQCTTFAITPLKWLRFLGFAIYGRQGYMSMSMNGPELDYTAQIEARSYYFVPDGEPRFVDVDAMDDRTSIPSDFSIRRTGFRDALIERDETCVFSGDPPFFCQACHLIPHSKGDSYMSSLFDHRREMYGLVDPLDNIDDTRNGMLLNSGFHLVFDAGDIAFLKTPNFALTVDDIPYRQPPNAGSPANRLTLQHIKPSPFGPTLSHFGSHNSDARQPHDMSQWPTAIIADLAYASTILRAWGPKDFIEYVRANSRDSYYAGGVEGEDGEDASGDPTTQVPRQPIDRDARHDRRSAIKGQAANPADQPTSGDMDMYDVVLALWMRAAREGKKRQPGSDVADVASNENKVQAWLQSVEASTS